MFEVGTIFRCWERTFRISEITFRLKPFPQEGARFIIYLDELNSEDKWVYVGEFTDITPDSLVNGLRIGDVEIVG